MPARGNAGPLHLSLEVGGAGSEASVDNLLNRHQRFSLDRDEAVAIIHRVREATAGWEPFMRESGVSGSDMEAIRWSMSRRVF